MNKLEVWGGIISSDTGQETTIDETNVDEETSETLNGNSGKKHTTRNIFIGFAIIIIIMVFAGLN